MGKDREPKGSDGEAALSRAERLAAELRANLRKRKSASRARGRVQSGKTGAHDHPGEEETHE